MARWTRKNGSCEPTLDQCRTGRVGAVIPGTTREMFYCRIDNEGCRFAMPFGFDYICQHLQNHQFPVVDDEDHGKVVAIVLPDQPNHHKP